MKKQAITPEVRAWIIEQANAARPPEEVLKSMLASGWNEDSAIEALEKVLSSYLVERQKVAAVPPMAPLVVPAPGAPVPEPLPSGMRASIWAGDREVQVLISMTQPRVVVFGGLFSHDECDALIELSNPKLARSLTVQNDTGSNQVHDARTSQGMFFARGEHPLVAKLETRMATLLRWPLENGEGLQVLRYLPGAEYKPHYDYFDPNGSGVANVLKLGGQRVASLVCYLNTPSQGGATLFPDVKLEVAPLKGNAVFFSYDRPHPSTQTLHAGAPVLEGEKWVATKWLRERQFGGNG
jgi:prolyl 4-hydroxylase